MEKLQEFLESDQRELNVPMQPIGDIEKAMKKHDWEMQEDWETNGWDHDFWIYFTQGDEKIMLAGSWYYGNYKLIKE